MKSAGNAYDELTESKAITRVGSRAYQSGDESDTSVITDGTTTYYALATPTETDADLDLDFMAYEDGTEQLLPINTATPTTSPILCDMTYMSISDEILYLYNNSGSSPGVPQGGTTGQALVKSSNNDYDTEWKTIMNVPSTYTTNHLAMLNSSGQLEDSGKSLADLQELLTAGTGINISNDTISNKFSNLVSGTDLNDVKYNYRGYVYQATNRPTGATNFGIILAGFNENGTRGQQIYVDIYEGKNFLYSRAFYDTTLWSAWRRIGDCYEVGDSYTKNYVGKICAGFIGANGTNLTFSIPMDKPINASNFTFTSLTITLYVNGARPINNINVIDNSDYSVTTAIPTDKTCITVTVTPKTPFSVGLWTCAVSVAGVEGTFS